jgi:hypothetical protein
MIKTRGLPLSRRVEARPSRSIEFRVSNRHWQLVSDGIVMALELTQDRVNHSKKGKVIYRQIDSVRINPVAAGLERQSQDPSAYRDC